MDMNYWVTGCITILVSIFGSMGFWSFMSDRRSKKSIERAAIQCVLFMAIKMSCKTCLRRGWVTTEEIEDIEKYMFEPYEKMGGNGTAKLLMDKIKALPSKPPKDQNHDYIDPIY